MDFLPSSGQPIHVQCRRALHLRRHAESNKHHTYLQGVLGGTSCGQSGGDLGIRKDVLRVNIEI